MVNQKRINDCLQLTNKKFRLTKYDPRFNIHNNLRHELAKCKLIYELKKEGKEVYAEVVFKNGRRADLLIPEEFKVIEVLESETKAEALSKTVNYPKELEIVIVDAKDILKEEDICW